MTQHTPGPWRDRIATGVPDHMISGGYDERQRSGQSVCVIPFKYGEGEGTARRNANARLIAAAPEMREAIKALLLICDDGSIPRAARALLAKIEGKE